jgi:hypothetical protein
MAVTAVASSSRTRWRAARLAWVLWALAIVGLVVTVWLDQLLRRAARPELVVLIPTAIPPVLGAVSTATVGALVASRRPRHPVGWLLLALGVTESTEIVADGYGSYGLQARPGTLPAAGLVALYNPATLAVGATCVSFVLLLTPTGSLPSRRWRWWARIAAAAPVAFVAAMLLLPEPLDPAAAGVDNPLAVHGLGGVLLVVSQGGPGGRHRGRAGRGRLAGGWRPPSCSPTSAASPPSRSGWRRGRSPRSSDVTWPPWPRS